MKSPVLSPSTCHPSHFQLILGDSCPTLAGVEGQGTTQGRGAAGWRPGHGYCIPLTAFCVKQPFSSTDGGRSLSVWVRMIPPIKSAQQDQDNHSIPTSIQSTPSCYTRANNTRKGRTEIMTSIAEQYRPGIYLLNTKKYKAYKRWGRRVSKPERGPTRQTNPARTSTKEMGNFQKDTRTNWQTGRETQT